MSYSVEISVGTTDQGAQDSISYYSFIRFGTASIAAPSFGWIERGEVKQDLEQRARLPRCQGASPGSLPAALSGNSPDGECLLQVSESRPFDSLMLMFVLWSPEGREECRRLACFDLPDECPTT